MDIRARSVTAVRSPTLEVLVQVLMWVAVLVVAWCVASIVTALTLGTWLQRRAEATDPDGALRPLDTGPLRLWLGDLPEVPATPDELGRRAGWDELTRGLDEDLAGDLAHDLGRGLPAPRTHSGRADRATTSR